MKTLLASAVALFSLSAFASEWEINPSHSTAAFSIRHLMFTNVHGTFGKVTGTVKEDDKDATKSTVEATIDASTINTNDPKRDGHLKSADFFDVEKFPTITFKSTKIEKAGGKTKFKIHGDLTMHGVTKPVVLDTTVAEKDVKDPFMNAVHRSATATTKVNRKDFGLTWNKALEGGGVLVGDDVNITLDVELDKKAEGAPAQPKG